MSFKEKMKVGIENEVLLIVEDRLNAKMKFFLESLQGTDGENKFLEIDTEDGEKKTLEVKICETSGEAEVFLWNNGHRVSIAILDCAFPTKKGMDAEMWAALDLMKIIRRGRNDVSIIINTGYDGFVYEDFSPEHVIYLSKNQLEWSNYMKNKCQNNPALRSVVGLLRENNKLKHPSSKVKERVVESKRDDKPIVH